MKNINDICIEYALDYGGGLPLTPEEMCNAVVLWVQDFTKDFNPETAKIDVYTLSELIEGSETIVVDINEQETALEVHLDGEILAKIDRAILTPITTSSEEQVPVVQNGGVTYKPLSEIGGGGSRFYVHNIIMNVIIDITEYVPEIGEVTYQETIVFNITITNNVSTPYSYGFGSDPFSLYDIFAPYAPIMCTATNLGNSASWFGAIALANPPNFVAGLHNFSTGEYQQYEGRLDSLSDTVL